MSIVMSPAKTLDFETVPAIQMSTTHNILDDSAQ